MTPVGLRLYTLKVDSKFNISLLYKLYKVSSKFSLS